ncbi:MAG: DUF1285 domain-containing protein [Myxococcales bacterium]|nr:DUF1285 domain-containing protein [Myxococcales bacterium]
MASLSPEQIEELRQSGILLDREGRLWHEGEQITHGRFQTALRCWLDVLPDGRTILRLDETRYAYVDVEDAHLLVASVRWHDDSATIYLNDGSSEELAYDTLEQSEDNALYCRVRKGKLTARFLTQAYYALAVNIDHAEGEEQEFALHARQSRYPIARRDSSEG